MLAFLACLAATQVPIDQPPRLRTILNNGAAILVEKAPTAKTLSVELFASSRGTEETPTTNGLRHLLEHLIARGPKGDLDVKLETASGFLEAETLRDAMEFKITVPSGQLPLALQIVEQLMQMPAVTTDTIKHEGQIIEQEAALRDDSSKFSAAAWTQAYGDKGMDVMGNPDVIRNATPTMLEKIHRTQFSGPNLAITVVGDIDLDAATKACSNILSKAPSLILAKSVRSKGMGGDAVAQAVGEGRALPLNGWRSPETAARIAAAFALASEADDSFIICTPAAGQGLVLFGRLGVRSGLAATIAKAKAPELFNRGRALARAWILGMLDSTGGIADNRGLLLVEEFDLKPETLLENLDTMKYQSFVAAMGAFQSNAAVTVEGK